MKITNFKLGFPRHPGQRISSAGAIHHDGAGLFGGLPLFKLGQDFNCINMMDLSTSGLGNNYAGSQVLGPYQSLESAAGSAIWTATASDTYGLEFVTAAAANAYYSLVSRAKLVSHSGGTPPARNYRIAGLARLAIPVAGTDRFGFGLVPEATAELNSNAVPASGSHSIGLIMTATGISGVAQGATAFGGGATNLGTFAELGITGTRYFTVGFNAYFSNTLANCRGEWWVNGIKFPVPAANLASFVTGASTRAIFTAHSSAGAATSVKVLAARVMAQYEHMKG